MISVTGWSGKGLALALVLVMGCTSVTDVRLDKLNDREKGRMAGVPGLRVHGYVPEGPRKNK